MPWTASSLTKSEKGDCEQALKGTSNLMEESELNQKIEELKGTVWVRRQLALAVDCTMLGLACILLFLWNGFGAWSMGLGMFIGIPLVVLGVILYLLAVAFDLKRAGSL
jgi:hypothetical protein